MNSNWDGKRVLITGAGGFIGSHLSKILVTEGARVRAFVRYNSRADTGLLKHLPSEILDEIEFVTGDLRDHTAIKKSVSGIQIVFHLGAIISIPYSYLHPLDVAETNFMGTLNVLQACLEEKVDLLIHTSTSEVYGTAITVPINESHPLQGQSPYSASKIGADMLVQSYFCAYDLPTVTVRPFNTYGPWQSARAVIPTIITQALTKDNVHLGNLETVRDFTYVSDTVGGLIKAAKASNVEGETFNLGTGTEVSVRELAEMIIRLVDRPVEIEVDPERVRPKKSEVLRLLSDASLARKHLDWQPVTTLEQGLNRTIEWFAAHLDRYRLGVYEF